MSEANLTDPSLTQVRDEETGISFLARDMDVYEAWKRGDPIPPGARAAEAPSSALEAENRRLREALEKIANATSAEADAGENYRRDDREGALDYAYATARAALAAAGEE